MNVAASAPVVGRLPARRADARGERPRERRGGTLTVPNTAQATAAIQRTPGGVDVIPDTAFKNGPASTIKDVLGWVPGVITQTRWGPDARVSIRGSGLSRSYGNRGLNVYMDGIPINTADGLVDLFEMDPTAYRYVEVYKGANALRYGANSLGGAVVFVTPTGRDASAVRRALRRRQLRPGEVAGQHRRRLGAIRLLRHRLVGAVGRLSRAQQGRHASASPATSASSSRRTPRRGST